MFEEGDAEIHKSRDGRRRLRKGKDPKILKNRGKACRIGNLDRDTVVGRRISMSIRHTEVSSVAIARIVKGGSSLATRRSLREEEGEVTVPLSSYFYGT